MLHSHLVRLQCPDCNALKDDVFAELEDLAHQLSQLKQQIHLLKLLLKDRDGTFPLDR